MIRKEPKRRYGFIFLWIYPAAQAYAVLPKKQHELVEYSIV
jgi:hypothetical protein